MNVIRTKVVELNAIPAVAYKVKLSSGGSGIKLHRTDREASAFAETDKRTGGMIIDPRADAALFPEAAFDEAAEELAGLPYSARGKVKVVVSDEPDGLELPAPQEAGQPSETGEMSRLVLSDEFNAVTDRYSDENGKINYALMNKQFIQFAAASKTVADMAGKNASVEDMLIFIIKNRAAYLAGKKETLTDGQTKLLIETIDEIDPRSAFKELNLYLRKRLAR